MIIPGFIIGILTFPGVIVHEAAHMLFCRLQGLAVLDAVFIQFKDPPGYVIHEQPRSYTGAFLVSMGPFFLNSILCVAFCSAALLPVWFLQVPDPFAYFFLWLGLSIGMHAFPSSHDLKGLFTGAPTAIRSGNVVALLALPLVAVLYLLNFLRFIWVDLIYGGVIGLWLPARIFERMVGS